MSKYQSGIIGQYNVEPIQILGETQKVHSTNYCISLSQLPSEYHRVKITGYSEVFDNETINITNFKVDYEHGKVYFNPIKSGTNITIKEYWGIGMELITGDRIATQIGDYGQAISTIYSDIEVVNQMKDDYYTGTHFEVMSSEQGKYTATHDGISYFQIPIGIWNPLIDVMDLIYNEIPISKDTHYSIDGGQIILLGWTLSQGDSVFFNVKKGVNSTVLVTADGSQITNGTVTQQKLSQDIQDKILINFPNVSPIEPTGHVAGRVWMNVNGQVSNIIESLPRCIYPTLSEIQDSFAEGNSNIYITTDNGKWNYWNGSAWIAGGFYQNVGDSLDSALKEDINIGSELHTSLTNDISSGNATKTALDLSIANGHIGNATELTTANKVVVGAINELDSDVGNKSTLTTAIKTSLVGAINENKGRLDGVDSQLIGMSIHIQHPPVPLVNCVCDGITDDSVAFQAINDYIYAHGGGEMVLPRSQNNILLLNQEINLNSNVNIRGYGWASKIITTVGTSGNGLNLLQAFEKSNITISKININNLGYGKTGTWTPSGTFNGIGACILMVGCDNVVVEGCIVTKNIAVGTTGETIGNIYFSCCTNSKIINNYVEKCSNGIVVDAWYNQAVGKARFINDSVIIQGNTVTKGVGRGICIENINSVEHSFTNSTERDVYFVANPSLLVYGVTISCASKLQKYYNTATPSFWMEYPPYGSIVVNGNTITKMAYAGIQGNTIYNCSITNNTIEGNQWGRDGFGNVHYFTWYGMEFVAGSKNAVISNNTIQNIKYNGIRCFEASDLIVSNNRIYNCEDFGIYIKNVNDTMTNVKVDNNIVNVNVDGIFVGRSTESVVVMKNNSCSNNTVDFSVVGGVNSGIQFDCHTLSKCDGNIVNPVSTHLGCTAIKSTSGTKNSINNNMIINATRGIDLTNDVSSISDSNLIENCMAGYRLDNSAKTFINSKFRGTTTAFDVANGQTTASSRCKALNCDFDFVDTIKNGTGVIVWTIGSGIPSGVWENGDRVRNDSPTVGGVSEWVYTTGSFRPVGVTS